MNEDQLRALLTRSVPPLRQPEDRVASVMRRSRQQQRRRATIAAATVAGVAAVAGAPLLSTAPDVTVPAVVLTQRPDGVLETPGCATFSNAPVTYDDGTPVNGNADVTQALMERLYPYINEDDGRFADVVGLRATQNDIGRLRIYRKPSAEFDAWILERFGNDCLEIAGSLLSQREATARTNRVFDEIEYWRGRGIDLSTASTNPIDGVVEVMVPERDLALAQEEMPARYPDLEIRVVPGEVALAYASPVTR